MGFRPRISSAISRIPNQLADWGRFAGAHTAAYRTAEQTCSLFQHTPITGKYQFPGTPTRRGVPFIPRSLRHGWVIVRGSERPPSLPSLHCVILSGAKSKGKNPRITKTPALVILSFAQNLCRCLCPCRCLFFLLVILSFAQNLCRCRCLCLCLCPCLCPCRCLFFLLVILSFAQNLCRCPCPCRCLFFLLVILVSPESLSLPLAVLNLQLTTYNSLVNTLDPANSH